MVLAKDEDALAAAASTLRDYFGPDLHLSAPQARLIGIPPHEPIMHVRVNVPVSRIESVKQQLLRRSISLGEESRGGTRCLLQGEAPLVRLLGLSADLKSVTLGCSLLWMKLARYEPCLRGPDSTAA
jgi:translation elongation factor EF-G